MEANAPASPMRVALCRVYTRLFASYSDVVVCGPLGNSNLMKGYTHGYILGLEIPAHAAKYYPALAHRLWV